MSGPITDALVELLQVPENATKAVLVLQGGKVPTLHITREIHEAGDIGEPMQFTHKFTLQPADLRTAVQIQCDEARERLHASINEATRRARRDLARMGEKNRLDHLYVTEMRPWIGSMVREIVGNSAGRRFLNDGGALGSSIFGASLGFYSAGLHRPLRDDMDTFPPEDSFYKEMMGEPYSHDEAARAAAERKESFWRRKIFRVSTPTAKSWVTPQREYVRPTMKARKP